MSEQVKSIDWSPRGLALAVDDVEVQAIISKLQNERPDLMGYYILPIWRMEPKARGEEAALVVIRRPSALEELLTAELIGQIPHLVLEIWRTGWHLVGRGVREAEVFDQLCRVVVTKRGTLRIRPPAVQVSPEAVRRYGAFRPELQGLIQQSLFPEGTDTPLPVEGVENASD